MSTFAVGTKDWGSPIKVEARQFSVVDAYRDAVQRRTLPKDRCYYGLGGQLFDTRTGNLRLGCEYEHLVFREKLLRPGQYHCIELNPKITAGNMKALPDIAHQFHTGDIGDVLYQMLLAGTFNPGLINLDMTSEPERSVQLLCDVMDAVNHVAGPVVVICNTILWFRKSDRKHSWEDVSRELEKSARFRMYYPYGWSQTQGNKTYQYDNTGARMGTFTLIRQGAALCSV